MAIAFELIRPNLDSSRRKAEAGRKGGEAGAEAAEEPESRPKAKRKQRASKKEKENEIENEIENERENEIEIEIETEKESEIENKRPLSPASRREGESLEAYSDRLKALKRAGFFDQKRELLRPRSSLKLYETEGTEDAFDTG